MARDSGAVLKAVLVGESLGRPFIGLKPGRVEQLLGGASPEGYLVSGAIQPDKPEKNCLPGLHGMSGQRLLASLAFRVEDEAGRGPLARVGAEIQALADFGSGAEEGFGLLRDPGQTLGGTIKRWRRDFPWEDEDWLAVEEDSQSIGCALLGFAGALADEPAAMAAGLARLTHRQCVAVAAPVAVAIAVRLCAEAGGGKKFDREGVARELVNRVKAFEEDYITRNLRAWKEIGWGKPAARLCDHLAPLPSLLREGQDDLAVKSILVTAGEHEADGRKPSHVQHGFAGAGLVWALYRGLGELSARRAVEDVLPRGGRCAVITGVVAGLRVARDGEEVIPDEWWKGCLGLEWAGRLAEATSTEVFEEWRRAEADFNGREDRMREPLREALRKRQALEEERARNHPASKGKSEPELPFAPPPSVWLKEGDEEDPQKKKILRALRGKKRIDWKEDRRRENNSGRDE